MIPTFDMVCDVQFCNKVCQLQEADWCFSPSTPVSSNTTDCHDIQHVADKCCMWH